MILKPVFSGGQIRRTKAEKGRYMVESISQCLFFDVKFVSDELFQVDVCRAKRTELVQMSRKFFQNPAGPLLRVLR